MSFAADENSVEDSAPREGFEIKHGEEVYRIASGSRNVLIGGNVYMALTSSRGNVGISFVGDAKELEIRLPSQHPLAVRYMLRGIPPKVITVSAWRKQLRSGEAERFWFGLITSCAFGEDHVASFRAPPLSGEALQRAIPSITIGRECPHMLYEAGCLVPRADFTVNTTVASHSGRVVTVASMSGNPDQWAQFGELVHVASGERMTIRSQVGTAVEIQLPIGELTDGDAVQVFAGCAHDMPTCRAKFANQLNYGGSPNKPSGNVFLPNGLGVYTSA